DAIAPAALVPLFNLTPDQEDWLDCQKFYLENPDQYPLSGDRPIKSKIHPPVHRDDLSFLSVLKSEIPETQKIVSSHIKSSVAHHSVNNCQQFTGILQYKGLQDYSIILTHPVEMAGQTWSLVTLRAEIDCQLQQCQDEQPLTILGRQNCAGNWIIVEELTP
ncbi:MAG TPA: hypothetical protein V6D27_05020, partial [Vampirovibrionales bacterium]